MIRSLIIIAATVLAALGGFWLYLRLEPMPAFVHQSIAPPTTQQMISTQPSDSPYGPGRAVWANLIDKNTGRLAERFRAAQYDPQANGTYLVIQPQAEFFFGGDHGTPVQVVRVVGSQGVINLPAGGGGGHDALAGGGIGGMPTRGNLHDVTITLYPTLDAEIADARDLTVTMPSVAFDNDTFRIYTPGDSQMLADSVPIVARGKDYDFDGRGLNIVWNDVDHQLLSLEIAHGHKLTIKHPGAIGGALGGDAAPGPASMISASFEPQFADAAGVTGAPAGAAPASDALSGPAASLSDPKHPVYRAQFFGVEPGDVRIVQSGATLVTADQMTAYFLLGAHAKPTTQPATQPAQIAPIAPPAPSDVAAPADNSPSTTQPDVASAEQSPTAPAAATTRPAEASQAPVDIFWTGPLKIAPYDPPSPEDRPAAGQSMVQFDGAPVTLRDNGATVTCATAAYRTTDGGGRLLSQIGRTPLHILTDSGATVDAVSANFSRLDRSAVVHGPGVIHFKDTSAGNAPVTVNFEQRCNIDFGAGTAAHPMLRSIALGGDVHIDDPALHMHSDRLTLHFAPQNPAAPVSGLSEAKTDADRLQNVIADDDVLCTIPGVPPPSGAPPRAPGDTGEKSISSDHLDLEMGALDTGKSYAKRLLADGSVHAWQFQQDLRCDHLDATLAAPLAPPLPKAVADAAHTAHHHTAMGSADAMASGSGKLEEMHATGDVHVTGKNGATASGEALDVTMKDDQPFIVLTGVDAPATVASGADILAGPLIKLSPHDGLASVVGAGTMDGFAKSEANGATRPIKMTWAQGITLDSPNNQADVSGPVVITARDTDGSVDEERSQNMHIVLMDKPADSLKPVKKAKPASDDATMGMDFMKNKTVRSIAMLGDAHDDARVSSTLTSPAGAVLRQMELKSREIDYDMVQHELTVPMHGRMLVEDRRPPGPENNGAAAQDTAAQRVGAAPINTGRGATAFQWEKQFSYSEPTKTAVMLGDVICVHEDPQSRQDPTRLYADKITAIFADAPANAPAPANPPARPARGNQPGAAGHLQLASMEAAGNVRVLMHNSTIEATTFDYNPLTDLAMFHGAGHRPVVFSDDKGHDNAEFSEIWLNAKTGDIEKMMDFAGGEQ